MKYGNTKVNLDGYKFDSKMEADRYRYLKNCKANGDIKDFVIHPKFILQPSFVYNGKRISPITYTSDFKVYHNDGTVSIEDVKGTKTNEFKIKEKMLKFILRNENNIDIYCITLYKENWVRI